MRIIQASIQHLDDLLPLFDGYRIFYRQPSELQKAKDFLKDRLTKQDTLIYIAYNGYKAVGFVQLFHSFSSVSMQPLFILNDLYVGKDHRNQGVGAGLLNHTKKICKEYGYNGMALETEADNPAQHLYESMDWNLNKNLHYFWNCE